MPPATAEEIAGNGFGSLTAVRNAVGARLGDNAIGNGDVPGFASGRGFTLTTLDLG